MLALDAIFATLKAIVDDITVFEPGIEKGETHDMSRPAEKGETYYYVSPS